MTKQVLKAFNIENDTFEDYVTECIIDGYPHNSKNDYAASAKNKIFEMGYLISLDTNENNRVLITLVKKEEKKPTFSCRYDTELEAVFEAFDWLLSL